MDSLNESQDAKGGEQAYLVAIHRYPTVTPPQILLDELADLVSSVGGEIAGREVFRIRQGRGFLGAGQRKRLLSNLKACGANLLVVSESLPRRHLLLLEEEMGVKVLDRTRLILDLFAMNARSREAKLQVEKAQLEYTLPRLTRMWTHLSRQVGGIGVRGPGETQLEVDRRDIRKRLSVLEERLRGIEGERTRRREGREGVLRISLVGYTNAGKSTLLNALTGADVGVEDRLFSTLDPTTRAWEILNQRILVTDTVGFIRDLPHGLVASFRATLGAVADADLILEVVSMELEGLEGRLETTESILGSLGASGVERWVVGNKRDTLSPSSLAQSVEMCEASDTPVHSVSAKMGKGMELFKNALSDWVKSKLEPITVLIPHKRGDLLNKTKGLGWVLEEDWGEEGAQIEALVPPAWAERLRAEGFGE